MSENPSAPSSLNRIWPTCLGLMVLTVVTYIPAMSAGFIWDDDSYITTNSTLTEDGGLSRIWTEFGATPQYYPMVFTSFWIETRLWGLSPTGFHVVNILLHGFAAILLWRVLLFVEIPGALTAAVLFAIHPVHVESVAWITERKNTLSTVFYLAAALQWLKWRFNRGLSPQACDTLEQSSGSANRHYALSILFFVSAVLSKSVTCSLPAALLLIVWLKTQRVTAKDVVLVSPLFAVGIIAGCVTIWMESHHVGAKFVDWGLSIGDRFIIAGRVIWFYAMKLVWPQPLVFIYPKWNIDATQWTQWIYPLTAIAVPSTLFLRRRRWGLGPLIAALFFGGTLFPALGFINVYPFRFSYVADHFQYLASLGLITLIAAGIHRTLEKHKTLQMPKTACSLLVVALVAISFNRCFALRDLRTLWLDTLLKNPDSQLAHTNIAQLLIDNESFEQAEKHLRRAVELDDSFHGAHRRLGLVLANRGAMGESLQHLKRAVEIAPTDFRVHFDIAKWYVANEQLSLAEEALKKAQSLVPNNLIVIQQLGFVLQMQGKFSEALKLAHQAIAANPNSGVLHYNLGVLLNEMKRPSDAVRAYREAIHLDPTDAFAHFNLANLLVEQGQLSEAIPHYESAIAHRPNFPEARQNLALAKQELADQ